MRGLSGFLPLVVLAVLFYLLLVRPQRNRQQQAQALLAKIGPGDQVMTSSGLFGTVAEVEDDAVFLEVAPDVELKFVKAAIQRIVTPAGEVVATGEPDLLDEDIDAPVDAPASRPGGATIADQDLPADRR